MSKTKQHFPQTSQSIVYVRPVQTSDLPKQMQMATSGLTEVYAIHDENGEYLGLAKDRAMAFVYAKQHDLAPMSVH